MAEQSQVTLENEILRVVSLPFMGGKITSLFHKGNAFEAAAQKGENAGQDPAKEAAVFSQERSGFARYAYGLDDAFPNIDEEDFVWRGKKRHYPDHGEIWGADFRILEQEKDFLKLCWESADFAYRYEKTLRLAGNTLRMHYRISNTGKDALPAIWTWHGLMRYEEDMEILLPEGTKQCRNVLSGSILGGTDTVYPYKSAAYDFTKVPSATSKGAVKYYVEPEMEGGRVADSLTVCCRFFYPSKKMCCLLRYDAGKLPYLGVWITAGGFLGDYNCALEPTNGFYDSISRAEKNHRLPVLAPGETMEFGLGISLCPQGVWPLRRNILFSAPSRAIIPEK